MRSAAAIVGAFTFAATVAGQGGVAGTLTTIDGRALSGSVSLQAGEQLQVLAATGETLAVPLADALALESADAGTVAPPASALRVWLRSGSVLPASAIEGIAAAAGQPASVRIRTTAGGEVAVPLTTIAALGMRDPEPQTFAVDRAAPETNLDYLYVVKDGKPQRFSVTVVSMHDQRVHFDLRGRGYEYPLAGADAAAAIVFGQNTGFAPDRQGKPRVLVALRSGERIEGRLLRLDDRLRVRLDEGGELEVEAGTLLRLDVLSDKLTWLGSLAPQVEQVAAFDRSWTWTVDRSPAGPGILLGNTAYERGLVLVPKTRLTYDVGGRFDYFEAVIGIDARGGPQAHAVFRVLVDDKLAFESPPMTLADPALPIKVELGKCQRMAIEVDFGKNFDLGDLCAFADARIVQR